MISARHTANRQSFKKVAYPFKGKKIVIIPDCYCFTNFQIIKILLEACETNRHGHETGSGQLRIIGFTCN